MFKKRLFTLLCVFGLVFMLFGQASPVSAGSTPVNPGFEDDNDVTAPSGWTVTGDTPASYTEWGGYSGNWRLSNWSADPYVVETSQTLTGLGRGWYTLRAWVKSSGGQNEA